MINTFKTYDEQIADMQKYGITVKNKRLAEEFLKKANYYRILPYIKIIANDENENNKFERLKEVYIFDNEMRNIIYDNVQDIEFYLRTQISHYHSLKYGDFGYLNKINFSAKHDVNKFHSRLNNSIEVNHNNPILRMYHDTEKYPLNVVIEFFSMNMLETFYDDMITENKKKLAGEMYSTTARNLESWLACLTDIRNRTAHFCRFYAWQFSNLPVIPREINFQANRRLFTQLLVLQFLVPDTDNWNNITVPKIFNLIDEYSPYIEMNSIGFPNNAKQLLYKRF